MIKWKKIGCIVGGSVAAAGAVFVAPFVATTATAIAAATVVGGALGAAASAFFDGFKLVFLMQGDLTSGKTTIIRVLTNKPLPKGETTNISTDPKNPIKFKDIGFIDVAANDLGIKDVFASLDTKAKKAILKKAILYVFNAYQYAHNTYNEEVQKAIKFYQTFCETNELAFFAVGTRGDDLSDRQKNEIKKEILDLSLINSNKSKVAVQIIDARSKDHVYKAIKEFYNQATGENF